MKLFLKICLFCLIIAVSAESAFSDVLWTADGSRLVGTVEQLKDGKLKFNSNIAGAIEVDYSQVIGLETDSKVNVAFDSGDQLLGSFEQEVEDASPVMHTALGAIPVSLQRAVAIWPEGGESPKVVALKEEAEKNVKEAKGKWKVTAEGGFELDEGNTEELDAHARLTVRHEWSQELIEMFIAAAYAEDDNVRSENEIMGGILYENSFYDGLYWYLRQALEYDEFENLDLRSVTTAGLGYYWLRKPDHEFKTRAGLGYRHESYDDGGNENEVVFDLGWDYRLDVKDWTRFTHSGTYSPSLEDFSNYRLDLDTAMVFPLDKNDWRLKLGVRNEYNSRPDDDLEKWDNTYYANIVFTWE
jgi:putative salt-induced outer membrane protein YdiY